MPIGIRPLSDLLLSHRFFRFFLVCLHLVVFFGQRSIANVDLAENFKIFDLDWNSSNDSFDVSDDSITQFLFFDNNHYVFRNHSSEKLLVSDQLNGNYFGSEVFENNTSGPERYLVFSPESNQSISRNFFYYNPNQPDNFIELEVIPFIKSNLIEPPTPVSEAKFGYALGVNAWSQVAVGAPGENSFEGKVYVFDLNSSLDLNPFQEVVPPVELAETNMQFGASLEIESELMLVGAPNDTNYAGSVFLYERDGVGEYQFISKITDPQGGDFETFGFEISIDSSVLAISSPQVGSAGAGKVSVFEIDSNQSVSFSSSISASDGSNFDEFGYDVEISSSLIVVGAPKSDNLENGINSGAAYVFERNSSNQWVETAKLVPSELSVNDQFGISVAISGEFIFVGSLRADGVGVDTGGVFVFQKINGDWQHTDTILPPDSSNDQLFSTAIDAVEEKLFVSSPASSTHGVVYTYKVDAESSSWKLTGALDYNGTSVTAGSTTMGPISVGQGMVVIGSPDESVSADGGGGVQTFFNPAWRQGFQLPELSPLLSPEIMTTLNLDEDSGVFEYDLNASHPFDDNLTWTLNGDLASLGSLSIESDTGNLSLTPNLNANGSANIQVEVNSDDNGSLQVLLEFVVSEVNDSPAFTQTDPSPFTLDQAMEGTNYEQFILLEDIDGDPMTLSLKTGSTLPDGLSISPVSSSQGGHKIFGVPAIGSANSQGYFIYNFTLIADDGFLSSENDFSLRVYKNNEPPEVRFNGEIVSDINLELAEDFSESDWLNAIAGIEFNDPNGDDLNFTLISPPEDGEVHINEDQGTDASIIIFEPLTDQYGLRSFTIRISDLGNPVEFQSHVDLDFNIEIAPVEDMPRIVSLPPPTQVSEGEEFSHTFEVVDPDAGDEVTFTVEGLPDWISLSEDNRTLTGTPAFSDYNDGAPSTFFVSFTDGNAPAEEQFYSIGVIPLNFPPVINEPFTLNQVIDEDETPTQWNPVTITANDPDANSNSGTLVWTIEDDDTNGSVSLFFDGSNVIVDYMPEGNFSGVDFFSIKVSEENYPESSDSVLFSVEVNPIEDDPVFRSLALYTQAVVGYSWEYEVLVTDGDLGQQMQVEALGDSPPWLSLIQISNDSFLLRGTPPVGQDGNFSVNLIVYDENNNSSEQEFNLEVLLENTPPELPFEESTQVSILEDEIWQPLGLSVVDPDNQKITWTLMTEPNHGNVEFTPVIGKEVNFSYAPDGNYSGSDFFSIRITDGISSDESNFSIEITPVPDPPALVQFPILTEITDDETVNENIVVSDGDSMQGLVLSYSDTPEWMDVNDSLLENNGTIWITGSPSYEDDGLVEVVFTITDDDGLSVQETLAFTVFVYNMPPVFAQNEHTVFMTEDEPGSWSSPQIVVTDDQTQVSDLSWRVSTNPLNGSASIAFDGQNLVYIPEENFSGNDSFVLEVTDNGGSNSSLPKSEFLTINVVVSEIDDPPVFVSSPTTDRLDSVTWNDESLYHYLIEAVDPDGNYPSLKAVSDLPPWLSFVTQENTGFGVLSGLAKVSDQGRYRLSFEATDGNTTTTQNFDLIIRIDDFPPAFFSSSSDNAISKVRTFMNEDGEGDDGWSPPTSYYCLNPDGGVLAEAIQWSVASNPSSGAFLQVSGTGVRPPVFEYVPPPNFNGYDEFYLEASDGRRTSTLLFEVFIKSIPDKPSFILPLSTNFSVENGESFEIPLEAEDEDSSNLSFKFVLPEGKDENWIELSQNNEPLTATLFGTPPSSNKNKTIPLTLLVTDDDGMFDKMDLVLSVSGSNQAPVISSGNEMTIVFSNSGIPISDNFQNLIATDADGDDLFWEILNAPQDGTLSLDYENGQIKTLTYNPASQSITEDKFLLRVSDGTKYDTVEVTALVSLDPSFTIVDGNESLILGQGVFFANDFTVINQSLSFEAILDTAPTWVSINKLSEQKVRISGTTPSSLVGSVEVSFQLIFEDGIIAKNMTIDLEDMIPPEIILAGNETISLKQGNTFIEPGYQAIDQDGTDYTSQVIVSPNPDDLLPGVNVLEYKVEDSNGNFSRVYRNVIVHTNAPISFSNAFYLQSEVQPQITWSEATEKIVGFTSLQKVTKLTANQSSIESSFAGNDFGLGKFSHSMDEIIWEVGLTGNSLTIDCLKSDQGFYYLAGTFQEWLSVSGTIHYSNQNNAFYLLKVSQDGSFTWLETFDTSNKVNSIQLTTSSDGRILLGGDFSGSIFLQDKEDLISYDQSRDFFVLKLNELGILEGSTSFGQTGEDLLQSLAFHGDNDIFILSNTQKPSQENYGLLLKLDDTLEIVAYLSFESDEPNSCSNLVVENSRIFLSVDFDNRLLMGKQGDEVQSSQNEILADLNGSGAVLMKLDPYFEIDWVTEFQAERQIQFLDLEATPFDDVIGLISHDGNLSNIQQDGNEGGGTDLSIIMLQGESGSEVWSKKVAGEGNEENASLIINDFGSLSLLLQTEQGVVLDSTEFNATQGNEFLLIDFLGSTPLEFIHSNDLQLQPGEIFSTEINLLNQGFSNFALLEAPSFFSIYPHGNGSCTLAGTAPLSLTGGSIVIRAYDFNGGFSDLTLDYGVESSETLDFREVLPGFSQTTPIDSDGKIIELLSPDGENIILAGNALADFSFGGKQFSTLGRQFSFIFFTNSTLELDASLVLQSSQEVFLSSAVADKDGTLLCLGSFKDDVTLDGQKYYSKGGYDIFLLEVTDKAEIISFNTFGGTNDEFASKLHLDQNNVSFTGQFWGTFPWGSASEAMSLGSQDSFVAICNRDNLANIIDFRNFGGTSFDEVTDQIEDVSGRITVIGNFLDSMEWGSENVLSANLKSSYIGIFEENGDVGPISVIDSDANIKTKYLLYDEKNQYYVLAGEFDGKIKLNHESLYPVSGLDIFLAILDRELRVVSFKSIGGNGTDKITDLSFDAGGDLLLSGTFTDTISLGEQSINASGPSNSFISKIEYPSLKIKDHFTLSSTTSVSIDKINSIHGNYLLYGSQSLDGAGRSFMEIGNLGTANNIPKLLDPLPDTSSSDLFFYFEFLTGPWIEKENDFSIHSQIPPWLNLTIHPDGSGNISGQPPESVSSVVHELEIGISTSNGEMLLIDHNLTVLGTNSLSPQVFLENQYSFKQYEPFEFSVRAFDPGNQKTIILPTLPDWLSWELIGQNKIKISGDPGKSNAGIHNFTIFVEGESGLNTTLESSILIEPNLGEEDSVEPEDLPEKWNNGWIGFYALANNGWVYHLNWGWIWLEPSEQNEDLWFFKKEMGWFWTDATNWDGPNERGFVFSDYLQEWHYLVLNDDGESVYFDYTNNNWNRFDSYR